MTLQSHLIILCDQIPRSFTWASLLADFHGCCQAPISATFDLFIVTLTIWTAGFLYSFRYTTRAIVPKSGSVVPNHICYSCLWVVLVVFTHALASLRFNWTPYVVLHGLSVFWHLPTTCVLSTIIICRRCALSCLNGALPATIFALAKRRVDSSIP